MEDYYKILGVNEDASSTEIRDRYIELAKLYHPDTKESDKGSDRIKEINEAYEVLKDDVTRMDYDLRRSLRKAYLKGKGKGKARPWLKKGTILFISIFFTLVLFGLILWKRPAVDVQRSSLTYHPIIPLSDKKLEPETRPKELASKITPMVNPEKPPLSHPLPPSPPARKPEPPQPEAKGREVVSKTDLPVSLEKPSITYPSTPPISAQKTEPVEPEAGAKEVVPKTSPVVIQQESKSPQINSTATSPISEKIAVSKSISEIEKPSPMLTEKPKPDPIIEKESTHSTPRSEARGMLRVDTERPFLPRFENRGLAPSNVSKKEDSQELPKIAPPLLDPKQDPPIAFKLEPAIKAIPPSPPILIEEEIRRFLADYIDLYVRKDIEGFLGLFSPGAIQNGKDNLEKIKAIYIKFFDQSETLFYRLEEVKISIGENNAEVRGRYQVNQKLKNQLTEKLWRGNLRWELVKKEGTLKITVLNYQNDKSP
ncbi:MAG: hypothetical protein FJ123_16040 [Deltaproteobacteria bacterium]|nr:hypothetical protein [Deltaproteobacteria bacterium]